MNHQATIQPYLFFNGQCEAALEFYRRALGAEVTMQMRYKDSPEPPPPARVSPGWENKIMHAEMRIGGTPIMMSDGRAGETPHFGGFSLSIAVPAEADVDRIFNGLAEGGQVHMAPTRTFFSPRFGMVVDRFGLMWMVIARAAGAPGERKS